jgi:hypothetical protein
MAPQFDTNHSRLLITDRTVKGVQVLSVNTPIGEFDDTVACRRIEHGAVLCYLSLMTFAFSGPVNRRRAFAFSGPVIRNVTMIRENDKINR